MKTWIRAASLGIALALWPAPSGTVPDQGHAAPQDAAGRMDPALVRREMLARLDARIDAQATQAHLDARLTLDEVMPIPYLGVDLETVDGGARITSVYPETGAAAAGLRVGDVIRSLGGEAVDSKPAVGRRLRTHRIGETIPIVVVRGQETLTIPATPGPRPEEDEDEEEQFPDLPPRIVLSTAPFSLMADADFASHVDAVVGGHGRPSLWVVMKDGGSSTIRQAEADRTGIRFPMAIVRGSSPATSSHRRASGMSRASSTRRRASSSGTRTPETTSWLAPTRVSPTSGSSAWRAACGGRCLARS